MNIVPGDAGCVLVKLFQSALIYRSLMTAEYYHYLAMASPSDYGVQNMFKVFHGT